MKFVTDESPWIDRFFPLVKIFFRRKISESGEMLSLRRIDKAGYTATLVACGWVGAAKKKLSVTDGPTDRRTERVVESCARD